MILWCILVASSLALSEDGKCRVLAMKGGGVHGSYEAGVLKAFMEKLDPSEYRYDYVSGVSIGAMNAGIFALHAQGDEQAAVDELLEMYRTYLPGDMFGLWKKPVKSLFTKKSLLDTAKMREIIAEIQDSRPFARKVSF